LCLGFGAWCIDSDYARGRMMYTISGYISFALGIALVAYEVMFLRKFKDNHNQ
jgi:hypothetical protein